MSEQHEQNQDQRIQALEERLEIAEKALTTANSIILGLQRSIVDITADHVHRIFNDPVMVDSLAQRFFIAAANAIAFKAKASKQRTPQLVVIEQYIPGVIRATLQEDGSVFIEEETEAGQWKSGEDLSPQMQSEEVQTAFGNLLIAYTAEVGKAYFITEDVFLEEFREKASQQALGVVKAVEEVAGAVQVRVTTCPLALGDDAAPDLEHPFTVDLPADAVFQVEGAEGLVETLAIALKEGDKVQISRNGAVIREVVTAVTPVVAEAAAEAPAAEAAAQ
ncbi:hypothetical protein D3C78_501830 [compost metagenome]